MTAGDLKKELEGVPDNQEVMLYIDDEEVYGGCDSVEVGTKLPDDGPYAKGDVPSMEEPVCLIRGWRAS